MIKRRHFLQFAASTLASLGLSPLRLQRQGICYGQALAQPSQRKQALLVGVNQYNQRLRSLKGCVTDVDLQRELLIHRFGFNPADILCLKDQDATRENILDAFEDHLIDACGADDLAVFHFSGHGRRIADPSPVQVAGDEHDPLNSTLIPYHDLDDEDDIPDIMGRTLFLLTSHLRTDNITLVLDSCYAEGGIRGNVRIRSGGNRPSRQPSQTELDYQAALREQLGLSPEKLQDLRDVSIAKGIALAAARRNQKAADVTFGAAESGEPFHAGAFTYFLTQYLWHEAEPVQRVIANVSRNLADDTFSQDPTACVAPFECNPDNPAETQVPTYFVDPVEPDQRPPAEGVILSVNEKRGAVWFGGSDRHSLATYGTGATFMAIAPDGTLLQDGIIVRSRQGLQAEVILSEDLPAGTLLQEASRVIPTEYKLRVGLDPSVMAELDAIQTTFGAIRRLELVPYQSDETLYADEVHYILSRLTADYMQLFQSPEGPGLPADNPPEPDSLVIFSQGLDEIIPGSWAAAGERVEEASDRLSTKFNALVAARLVKLLINAHSSRLDMRAEMRVGGVRSQLAQFFTVRGSRGTQQETTGSLLEVPVGRSLQFVVTHQEPEPIYVLVFIVDRTGDIFPVFPRQFLGITAADTLVAPNQSKLIPDPVDDPPLNVTETGFGEVLIIASRSPLTQAMRALSRDRTATTPVVDALMGDLSGVNLEVRSGGVREFRIQAAEMAAMAIPFRVVE